MLTGTSADPRLQGFSDAVFALYQHEVTDRPLGDLLGLFRLRSRYCENVSRHRCSFFRHRLRRLRLEKIDELVVDLFHGIDRIKDAFRCPLFGRRL